MHLFALVGLAGLVSAVATTVRLDYATYRGANVDQGITRWSRMRFAAPPIGSRRFQAPVDPPRVPGIVDATQDNPVCLPVSGGSPDESHLEDCLYITVTAPAGATTSSKLPVYFYLQGGGFASDAGPNPPAQGLVAASGNNIIVVNHNYRVGVFGFLAGDEVAAQGSLNNGFKDQLKALEWTKNYIAQFGGDPDHIVIGGDSAGGQSTALHLVANGGQGTPSFVGAIGSEVSTPRMFNTTSAQFLYDTVARRAGCAGDDSFACLVGLTSAELQASNTRIEFPGAQGLPLFSYNPIVDDDIFPDTTSRLFAAGRFYKVPTIMGDDENGGTSFAPRDSNSYLDSSNFLKDNFNLLTTAQLYEITQKYPISAFPQRFPGTGAYWRQTSQAYGDLRYKCPGLRFSSAIAGSNTPSYAYRFAVLDPEYVAEGLGTPHTMESGAVFGPAQNPPSMRPGGSNADVVGQVQGYWASFIRSLDPNLHKRPQDPVWGGWNGSQRRLLRFVTNQTAMVRQDGTEQSRCAYYAQIASSLGQ